MKSSSPGFDGLTGAYRALEFLAFGRDLERARFAFLDRLRDCQNILVLGEGDGRALARLVQLAPVARIHCLDLSPTMLARAAARLSPEDRARVTFQSADILATALPVAPFDAVTTLFFLDCFTPDQVSDIVARVQATLTPKALWIFVDFSMPPKGYARLRARAWLALLYAFFRWQTKLPARALPPTEKILADSGWSIISERDFQNGLIRTVVLNR
jgi:ubiquinone/menaquinone biosynthesis C-methylase UbiE